MHILFSLLIINDYFGEVCFMINRCINRFLTVFTTLVLCITYLFVINVLADDNGEEDNIVTIDYVIYSIGDDEVTVIGYVDDYSYYSDNGYTIKSSVDGKPVTTIGDQAFKYCNSHVISIPNSVKSIGNEAFYGSWIKSIDLPTSLVSIGEKSFGSTDITSVTIPGSISSISKGSFYFCSHLETVYISEGVTGIEEGAFHDCSAIKTLVLPNSLIYIDEFAFISCKNLESVSLPESLEEIRRSAFRNCINLESVVFPSSLKFIDNYAFADCTSLSNIVFNEGVKQINTCAFLNIAPNATIYAPKALESIGSYFFGFKSSHRVYSITTDAMMYVYPHTNPEAYAIACNIPYSLYEESILITDIDAPVATKSLDKNASVYQSAFAIESITWSSGNSNNVSTADYSTSYTVNIKLVPNLAWCNEDTKFIINNKSANLKTINEDGSIVVSYTFEKTEPKPTPVPVATSAPQQLPEAELNVSDFVTRCYQVALSRTPDSEGYTYWCDNLNNGQVCGAQVGYGFIFSPEYIAKSTSNSQYVNDLYSMFFGREADADGFNYWLNLLNGGTSRENVFAGFANSVEFYNLCNKYSVVAGYYLVGVPNAQQGGINCFVARLYKTCLGRFPDQGSHATWVMKLYDREITGTNCAYGFIFSPEFIGKKLNNADFIAYMYRALFGREGSDSEIKGWLEQIDYGMSREQVFNSFAGSIEFDALCNLYDINR